MEQEFRARKEEAGLSTVLIFWGRLIGANK
jgi:hypothetical protein